MSDYFRRHRLILHFALAAGAFCIILLTLEYVLSLEQRSLLQRQRAEIVDKTAAARARLEGEINSTLHLTRGLIAYTATHPEVSADEFSQLASELIFVGRNVRNIALAKDNVISHMYPLAGNEAAIGLEYEKHPLQWAAVKRAIELKGTVVAGPVSLVQGGKAFIARTPIFTRPGISGELASRPQYWGLASIVINLDELFQSARLGEIQNGIRFALRGKDSLGAEGELIFGTPETFESNPVLQPISLPNGSWQLAALPEGGWGSHLPSLLPVRLLGWLIAAIIGGLIGALSWTTEKNRILALHDHLTHLPNRRLLEDRMKQAIASSRRADRSFGLIFIDLNDFKGTNDKLGHKVGDGLLIETAQRMLASVREVDTVARIGGDEFVVLVNDLKSTEDLSLVQKQIRDSLQGAAYIDGNRIEIKASLGIAIYPTDGESIDQLLKSADSQMYKAKQGSNIRQIP